MVENGSGQAGPRRGSGAQAGRGRGGESWRRSGEGDRSRRRSGEGDRSRRRSGEGDRSRRRSGDGGRSRRELPQPGEGGGSRWRSGEGGARRADQSGRPRLPAGVTAGQLDPAARAELRTLPAELAESVARWLAAAAQEPDPGLAYDYARQARRLAARVGIVRETCGIAAYRAGRWAEALAELRTARRLTGNDAVLPLIADSERALGRLDRALAVVHDPAAARLGRAAWIELRIVESGIRRDQGRPDAGAAVLRVPELDDGRIRPWSARLFYAYADALLEAGRTEEAREWFGRAAAADTAGETDAAERFEHLAGVDIEDLAENGDPPGSGPGAAGLQGRAGEGPRAAGLQGRAGEGPRAAWPQG
jgi:tetratricopeptide (TPR) repeat protein